jgi:tetratricopeptide (TPR) repeat protein
MSTLAFRRLAWTATECALVAASFLMLATPIRAASGASLEAVCNVNADYALGVEDYPEAIRLHERIVRQDPNDALAHYHLGYAYGMNHDAPAELREYIRARELGLREWDLFLNLGLLYMERNELPAAINALAVATALAPQRSEPHFNLSLAYERAGLLPEARREILASLRLEPDQPDAQNTLAVIDAEMGNYQNARAVWTKLLRIYPDYQPARKNIANLERETADNASPVRLKTIAELTDNSR